jgi:catecholate siderophore receptor
MKNYKKAQRGNSANNASTINNPGPLTCRHWPLFRAVRKVLVGTGLGVGVAGSAHAQQTGEAATSDPQGQVLEEILVTDERGARYRQDRSSLTRLSESLRETPQSIAVLSDELLADRGATSLNEALRNVPGITLGAGEFSWQGNNPSIRGFSARDDMYLDGIRDFGSYPRDPFNLEAVEVLLGPSSILFGRGSTGGAINQASKQPQSEPLTSLHVNLGNGDTLRGTADLSRPVPLLGDGAAFRLNLLGHRGNMVGREFASSERFGFAPSLALGLGSDTRLNLSYMKQRADDRPDYGLPWLDGAPAAVPRDSFYGFDSDYLETDADIVTAIVAHEYSETLSLDARLRYADYSRSSRITEPLIIQPVSAATSLADIDVYRYVFLGESDESLLAGQVNLSYSPAWGQVEHKLVGGVEWSREKSRPTFAFGIGVPQTNLLNPDRDQSYSGDGEPRIRADTTGTTTALYAIDTLNLSESWQLLLGLRWDRFDSDYRAVRFSGPATPFNDGTASGPESIAQVDEVLSYRAALIYQPLAGTSVYLAGSTSFNPSAQGLSQLTSGRGLGVGNARLDPEENRSLELGMKTGINNDALLLETALFEINKTNARIPDPATPGFNTLGGQQQIRGLSVLLNGSLGQRTQLLAGYAYLDSEVVEAGPGTVAGMPLANAPEHSLSLWANYRLTPRLELGGGARYVSEQLAQNTGAGKAVPGYTLLDMMGRYEWSDTLTFRLNLVNLSDRYYFEQLHPWHVVPGPGFTATFAIGLEL